MKRANKNKEEKDRRQLEAAGRAEYSATLTPQQKIARLDARLGTGLGAVKERAKLAKVIAEAAKVKPAAKETPKAAPEEQKGGGKIRGKKGNKQQKNA